MKENVKWKRWLGQYLVRAQEPSMSSTPSLAITQFLKAFNASSQIK